MHERDEAASSGGAAPTGELPERAEPRLVTQYGDPLETPVAVDRPAASRIEAETARLAMQATAPEHEDHRQAQIPEPAGTSDAAEQAQRLRRVEEFAREGHPVRAWAGGEHSGTVVAAAVDGVVVHVGRSEYVHVPAQRGESFSTAMLGRHVSVGRSGHVVEMPRGFERAGR